MLKFRYYALIGAALAAAVVAVAVRRWKRPRAAAEPPPGAVVLRVPHAPGPIVVNGETDDRGWLASPGPARTGDFHFAGGAPGRPYSEARITWADGTLFFALYAADEDIRARTDVQDGPLWLDDSFRMTFRRGGFEYAIEVSPKCVVSDGRRRLGDTGPFDYSWSSHVRVGCDTDGTINDPRDMDEEWVVEVALPLTSIGVDGPAAGASFGFSLQRCDTPKGAQRVCIYWGEEDRGWLTLQ